jgi:hypothetical protein
MVCINLNPKKKIPHTNIDVDGEGMTQCLFYTNILAADSIKPNKLKSHFEMYFMNMLDKHLNFSVEN